MLSYQPTGITILGVVTLTAAGRRYGLHRAGIHVTYVSGTLHAGRGNESLSLWLSRIGAA
jgi:hypothetical protein